MCQASRALALLPPSVQESVLKYYFVRDAKMSLASHILKHLIITKYCNVSWSRSTISAAANGKPCFAPSSSDGSSDHRVRIDFNVSHQAGVVSLIAAIGFENHVDVGTDVVCWNERLSSNHQHIDKSGFFDWIDMHGEVFAEEELKCMRLATVNLKDLGIIDAQISGDGEDALSKCQWRNRKINLKVTRDDGRTEEDVQVSTNPVIDAKVRNFYAMWCLREAYVKMTGEALLAPWLKDLEISNLLVPAAKEGVQDPDSLQAGEMFQNFRILFKGKPVTNVKMELSALGMGYMVCGSVRASNPTEQSQLEMTAWELLDLDRELDSIGV
ncbi:4'-phosphopantetheinyl transferase [Venustampulla echinocandica]|uniref:holo-[acyl-carrier-protein] synthase n=1 Tax=Venustampulla echinocandica TaxID=2656787 RepID=A0A370TKX6_9HELO|nr:4'-phosphopantetheinyl transferase [Venustampulla echinocandica]RDL36180.1 4'-phosphopantetheinyl transferase [Venustampulla echinocandica]